MVGETLGHYTILEKLGAGGMGEVYLAQDQRLDRQVALKVLPTELAESQERLDRFQREAKALAALDHPNIVHIYSVEEDEGVHFLTMQLVRGQRLSALIPRSGMPAEKIVDLTVPLADALAAAHEKGIVHRDLKPGNIMVTPEGRVKILDFGLAKLRALPGSGLATEMPTEPLTQEGLVLGTAPYMSPEQVEGKTIDTRSDIFSLGVVLYEMASGERPFQGESAVATMGRILESDPDPLGDLRPDLPDDLLRIVHRCLRKKPEDRYNDTRDLFVALKDLRPGSSSRFTGQISQETPQRSSTWRPSWKVLAGILLLVILVAGARFLWLDRSTAAIKPTPGAGRHQQITFSGDASQPEISPDGAFLAYATQNRIVVRDLEGQSSIVVVEAESLEGPRLRWSPDGLRLLVIGRFSGERRALVVPRLGGDQTRLPQYAHLSWSPDGSRVAGAFQNSQTISIVDIQSGEVVQTIEIGGTFRWLISLDWSVPTGLLLAQTMDDDGRATIWTLSPDGNSQVNVYESETFLGTVRWSLAESEIYFLDFPGNDAELWKLAVDAETGDLRDSPRLVLAGLPIDLTESLGGGFFSISRQGPKLAYTRTSSFSTLLKADLDRSGEGIRANISQIESGTQISTGFSISPNGEQIAISRGDERNDHIYLLSLRDGSSHQLTHLDGRNAFPVWSPDGQTIAFGSTHDGSPKIWRVNAEGGSPRPLGTIELSDSLLLEWSPGERLLVHNPGNRQWSLVDVGSGDEVPLLSEDLTRSGWFFRPVYSPDGSRVALEANLMGPTVIVVSTEGPRRPATVLASASGAPGGGIFQTLSASEHNGKAIRLKARGRVSGETISAQLLLRIQLENDDTGLNATLEDRSINSIEWSDYEITGVIDQNAKEIVLGGYTQGWGIAWFDDFEVSVRSDDGEWTPLSLANPSFEETTESGGPVSWQTSAPTASAFSITEAGLAPSGKALRIGSVGEPPVRGSFQPVGWTQDSKAVLVVPFAMTGSAIALDPVIYQIPAAGGPIEKVLDLELADQGTWIAMAEGGDFLVVETARQLSDIWMAEGFDPETD